MSVNIKRFINNLPEKNPYVPLYEVIVNAIQAIKENSITSKKGQITIDIQREAPESSIIKDREKFPISGFIIEDNGIGFNDKNTESFDELYTDYKINQGCQGYGRFSCLKIFKKVQIESIFQDIKGSRLKRNFKFTAEEEKKEEDKRDFIRNENISKYTGTKTTGSKISLLGLKAEFLEEINKKASTIAKRITEHLLPYFNSDDLAEIKIIDGETEIILNNSIGKDKDIKEVANDRKVVIKKYGKKYNFTVDIFAFYGPEKKSSSIFLTAHNRVVELKSISQYIPEFSEALCEKESGKNYYIKAYVSGNYLDNNIKPDRSRFLFGEKEDIAYPLGKKDIEQETANVIKEVYKKDYESRFFDKEEEIKKTVNEELVQFRGLLKDINFKELPYKASKQTLASKLHELQFIKEQETRTSFNNLLKDLGKEKQIDKAKFMEAVTKLTYSQKDKLAHYISLRKMIIQSLDKLLKYNFESSKFSKEEQMHNLIYPRQKDSDKVDYKNHNLRLLDERLTYSNYVSSDKPIFTEGSTEKMDLAIFGNKTLFQEGKNNPVYIYEFKRPGKKLENKDHIDKLLIYLEKVREGKIKDKHKRSIILNENTPIYCYLICDLESKITKNAKRRGFKEHPDGKGLYIYQPEFSAYVEILSWDKILDDANMRHRIFFQKLGIDTTP